MSKRTIRNPPLFESQSFGEEQVGQPLVFNFGTSVTLRDIFAAFSLAGSRAMEADSEIAERADPDQVAIEAYADADAMLDARTRSSSS